MNSCSILIAGGFSLNFIVHTFKKITSKQLLIYIVISLCCITSVLFVYNNYSFYERPIAKITQTNLVDTNDIIDIYDNEDKLYTQEITAEIKNGSNKGEHIHLINTYSITGAYDHAYQEIGRAHV